MRIPQPRNSLANPGLAGTLKVDTHRKELKDVPKRKDSLVVRKNPGRKEHMEWWLDDPVSELSSSNSNSSPGRFQIRPHFSQIYEQLIDLVHEHR